MALVSIDPHRPALGVTVLTQMTQRAVASA
jgi:hypothetical protein